MLCACRVGCEFVIATGDNFYSSGIAAEKGPYDPQWKTSFRDIYNASSLQVGPTTPPPSCLLETGPSAPSPFPPSPRQPSMPEHSGVMGGKELRGLSAHKATSLALAPTPGAAA